VPVGGGLEKITTVMVGGAITASRIGGGALSEGMVGSLRLRLPTLRRRRGSIEPLTSRNRYAQPIPPR